ncbi:restriction endonuclease [Pseudoalteromonas rubra]|uniref:Restriction endonuclease n=1 Tax=Pseudoalteromonas rubra TaxID=43658 RepID=A0A4Q7ECM4_9GAMM|nr:restriction endonuclease [Pseudoalteromonas rubra]RZM80364.1 restriction endonuclease [Pseudoalteromonas rubra]
MSINWKEYQEEAAEFFRSLGLEAETDVTIEGVRTKHDIDVLVKSHHAGFDITWIVECKHWQKPVSKLHVLGLREIVSDTGADRGILLSESGFQSGAIEAANLTNVHVTSLEEFRLSASSDIYSMRLRELYDRVESCKERYWDIPKGVRIEHGLRPEVGAWDFSGARVVELCSDILMRAFRGVYPLISDHLAALVTPGFSDGFKSPKEVADAIEPLVVEFESRLDAYDEATKNT